MKKTLISILVIGIAASLLGVGTFAYFSDTKSTPVETFTAGTLRLSGTGLASFDLGPIIDNMAPGDLTNQVTITIENVGTLPLFWFGDWVITGGNKLREAIYIDYAKMEFLPGPWEPADNFIANGVGAGTYPGWYNTLAGMSPFGVVTLKNWDDNNGMGCTPYEHMGALKPTYRYELTIRFGFHKDAGNEYQGDVVAPVNIKLEVDAIQVNQDNLIAFGQGNHWDWLNTQLAKQTTT